MFNRKIYEKLLLYSKYTKHSFADDSMNLKRWVHLKGRWCNAENRSRDMAAENIKTFDMRDVMVCLVDDIIDSTYHKIV